MQVNRTTRSRLWIWIGPLQRFEEPLRLPLGKHYRDTCPGFPQLHVEDRFLLAADVFKKEGNGVECLLLCSVGAIFVCNDRG